jgi:hypothetical protein
MCKDLYFETDGIPFCLWPTVKLSPKALKSLFDQYWFDMTSTETKYFVTVLSEFCQNDTIEQ